MPPFVKIPFSTEIDEITYSARMETTGHLEYNGGRIWEMMGHEQLSESLAEN